MDVQTFSSVMGGTLPLSRYQALLPAWNLALIQAQCTTVNRVAMIVAQVGHESVGLRYMSEIASGAAYEGRKDLGNIYPGDGVKFKGHGPIQITGRANHLAVSKWAYSKGYVPSPTYFIDHPAELGADRYGFLGVVWYWTVARNMNSYADRGDILGATKAVNGGTNGLADRTTRWKKALTFGTGLLPTNVSEEDELNDAQAKQLSDLAARIGKFDSLEADLRGDLHVKQLELDGIRDAVKALNTKFDSLITALTNAQSGKQP